MTVFKGFSFKLPTYTVLTPQTGESFEVRSMTVAEVSKMKTSLVTPNRAHIVINDVLWDVLEGKPNEIKTKDDFKRCVTTIDREALLYGLYHATFGDDREFSATCSNCGNDNLLKLKLSSMFSMNSYPYSDAIKESYKATKAVEPETYDPEVETALRQDVPIRERVTMEDVPDEILQQEKAMADISEDIVDDLDKAVVDKEKKPGRPKKKEVKEDIQEEVKEDKFTSVLSRKVIVELPISKVIAVIRQPTIYDEETVLNSMSFAAKKANELSNETLIIERFEEWAEGNKTASNVITNRNDILYGYQSLPPVDRTLIFERYSKEFGQYCIELKNGYECKKCGFENDLEVNVASQFFRTIALS